MKNHVNSFANDSTWVHVSFLFSRQKRLKRLNTSRGSRKVSLLCPKGIVLCVYIKYGILSIYKAWIDQNLMCSEQCLVLKYVWRFAYHRWWHIELVASPRTCFSFKVGLLTPVPWPLQVQLWVAMSDNVMLDTCTQLQPAGGFVSRPKTHLWKNDPICQGKFGSWR